MATGTDSRNVKMIIQGILQSNGIDNLKVEMQIFGAWMRYMNEREEGLTPAQVRAKIAKEYGEIGITAEGIERNKLKQRMEDTLGLSVDVGSAKWDAVFNFCMKQDKEGETIEKFWAWCVSDPYNSPKKHQIAQNPLLIKVMWKSAFDTVGIPQNTRPEYKKVVTVEEEIVQNPNRNKKKCLRCSGTGVWNYYDNPTPCPDCSEA